VVAGPHPEPVPELRVAHPCNPPRGGAKRLRKRRKSRSDAGPCSTHGLQPWRTTGQLIGAQRRVSRGWPSAVQPSLDAHMPTCPQPHHQHQLSPKVSSYTETTWWLTAAQPPGLRRNPAPACSSPPSSVTSAAFPKGSMSASTAQQPSQLAHCVACLPDRPLHHQH
jgi:hypothetical protein